MLSAFLCSMRPPVSPFGGRRLNAHRFSSGLPRGLRRCHRRRGMPDAPMSGTGTSGAPGTSSPALPCPPWIRLRGCVARRGSRLTSKSAVSLADSISSIGTSGAPSPPARAANSGSARGSASLPPKMLADSISSMGTSGALSPPARAANSVAARGSASLPPKALEPTSLTGRSGAPLTPASTPLAASPGRPRTVVGDSERVRRGARRPALFRSLTIETLRLGHGKGT